MRIVDTLILETGLTILTILYLMGVNVRWSNLILSLFLLGSSSISLAQEIVKDSLISDKNIVAYSLDQNGNLFLGYEGGTMTKFSNELDSLLSYNPTRVGDFSLIEAWHGFQVFAFNRKFQDFILTDRFLSRESRYNLGETGMFFVDLATLSGDQNLWLLEENGLRLMKYDFKSQELILDISLDNWLDMVDHDFTFIREYQNLLFLIDKNSGIYVFDNMANFLRKIDAMGVEYVSMSGESLYYIANDSIVSLNLYSNEIQKTPIKTNMYQGLLVHKKIGYLISGQRIFRIRVSEN